MIVSPQEEVLARLAGYDWVPETKFNEVTTGVVATRQSWEESKTPAGYFR